MKIVFTHTDFRIYWPARLEALQKELTSKGITFNVIEISGAGSPYSFAKTNASHPIWWHCLFPNDEMEHIPPKNAVKALHNKLDELMPDVVFSGAIAFPSGAGAISWAERNRKKVVIFDDARLEDVPRSNVINWIKRKIYARVDAILCPSAYWNDTFKFFGFNENQLFYGLNVVNNDFWKNVIRDAEIPELPEKYILSVGRQIPKKNYQGLLGAYCAYTSKVPNPLPLVLIGEGEERASMEVFCEEHNIFDVHFLPFVNQEQLNKIYHKAYFFVLPSLYGETWGLVVNEAMASGLPVIVSNQAGCASTLVFEERNGYSFSPKNNEELEKKLLEFHYASEERMLAMGDASIEIISNWNLDRFLNGVLNAIKFVSSTEVKKVGILSRIVIDFWKGRYRPT